MFDSDHRRAIQRDDVVIVGANCDAMYELGHFGVDWAGRYAVHTNPDRPQFNRLLLRQMNDCRLARAVGNA